MQFKKWFSLALASTASAQSVPSLQQAFAAQNSSLSTLNGLLAQAPQLVAALNQAQNITILAPNNAALQKLLSNQQAAAALAADPGLITALLTYHVLNGTRYAANINATQFIPTLLSNQTYANVTNGQRVQANNVGGNVTFYSALKQNSSVVTPNLNFTSGTIHIVDTVLSIPGSIRNTLIASNLTAAAGALTQASLVAPLSALRDVTVFAPSNAAFGSISSITSNITNATLASILGYHVINGTVGYSTRLTNTTLKTLGGQNVTITVANGSVFVNSAKVIISDVLVANGVVHVIDNVLNPSNTVASPNPTGTNSPAFSGASSATSGGVPFTSGVPTPSSTAPVATGAGGSATTTSSSSAFAMPMQTGAVGAAALFGGAAILANL